MLKKRIRKSLIYIVLLGLICITSCGKQEEVTTEETENQYLTVGFSQVGAESDWRVANTESMKQSLSRENGIELMFDDAQQKQDRQILAIRNYIQQEVDYIVLAPVTETGWDTVLQEAQDAGIPVIVVDRMVDVEDTNLFNAWVGSNFRREGDIACEWLNQYVIAKEIPAESINIVDIQGTIGATSQIGRSKGLEDAAAKYGWNLLNSVPADYAQTKSKEVVAELLTEYSNINVVYCENDNEAMGAIEAIEEAGLTVGTDITEGEIMIISFDATNSGLTNTMRGKITLDVECNPLQGESVKNLINSMENGGEYNKYTYIEEKVFSIDDTVKEVKVGEETYTITHVTEEIINSREY